MAKPPKTPSETPAPPRTRRKTPARKPAQLKGGSDGPVEAAVDTVESVASTAASRASDAAKAFSDTVKDAASTVVETVEDAAGTVTPPKQGARRTPPRRTSKSAAGSGSSKRSARGRGAGARRPSTPSAPAKLVKDTRDRMGDRNFFGAIIGGFAALGALATATMFALKSRTPSRGTPNPGKSAHQPDGTDSSASFEAMIADESTIPEA